MSTRRRGCGGGGGGDTSLPAQGASSVLSRKGSSARYVRGADRRYTKCRR